MKYSELCAEDREFLSYINYTRQNDRPAYIAAICIMLSVAKVEDGIYPTLESLLTGATKKDFEEAIKAIREAQPEGSAHNGLNAAIDYIREKWLREEDIA